MVELRDINEDNFGDCLKLEVNENQKDFVAENIVSIAQAWLYQKNAQPFAIYNNDEIVGFVMLDIDGDRDGSKRRCGLWRFMIDKKYQGKGYGKESMKLILEYAKKTLNSKEMETSIVKENIIAEKLYKSFGFEFNGEVDEDDERIMLLNLSNK